MTGSIRDSIKSKHDSVKSKKSKRELNPNAVTIQQAADIDIETLKDDILDELRGEFQSLIRDLVHKEGGKYPEESSEDSAYQAALELGSDFYGGRHASDRARHRNFRKCKFDNLY